MIAIVGPHRFSEPVLAGLAYAEQLASFQEVQLFTQGPQETLHKTWSRRALSVQALSGCKASVYVWLQHEPKLLGSVSKQNPGAKHYLLLHNPSLSDDALRRYDQLLICNYDLYCVQAYSDTFTRSSLVAPGFTPSPDVDTCSGPRDCITVYVDSKMRRSRGSEAINTIQNLVRAGFSVKLFDYGTWDRQCRERLEFLDGVERVSCPSTDQRLQLQIRSLMYLHLSDHCRVPYLLQEALACGSEAVYGDKEGGFRLLLDDDGDSHVPLNDLPGLVSNQLHQPYPRYLSLAKQLRDRFCSHCQSFFSVDK